MAQDQSHQLVLNDRYCDYSLITIECVLSQQEQQKTRGMVWRDSVGVESSRSGLQSECADIFHRSFLWLLRHADEPQKGRNSCLLLQSPLF